MCAEGDGVYHKAHLITTVVKISHYNSDSQFTVILFHGKLLAVFGDIFDGHDLRVGVCVPGI